jgi:hypothetical protein
VRAVLDAVRRAAQRHHGARGERRGLRQPAQPRRDPGAVLLRESLGVGDAAAQRHGENNVAARRLDAQGVAARLPVPAQAHRIDDAIELDLDGRYLARPPIKPREQPHGSLHDSRPQ